MNTTNLLFPTELLVKNVNGKIFTDSRLVSEYFGRRHKNVLRDIEILLGRLLSKDVTELKSELSETDELIKATQGFISTTYFDSTGRSLPMYLLTRNAFSLLTNRFTNKKSLIWQVRFNNAFNQMELELNAYKEKESAALRQLRPCIDPVVKGTEQGLSRLQIAVMINKTPSSVSYHRSVARRLGLLPEQKH